jgi:hypothetical protein
MATASSTRARRPTVPLGRVAAARRVLPALAVVLGVAVAMWAVYDPWYLNYDARYALLWAQDLAGGFLPEYRADFAPTPKPLQTATSALALPFGDGGDTIVVGIVLLAFGALVWLTYRLGAVLFGPWAGAVAALVVLTRPAIQRDVLLAYQDIPFAALVVGAVLLEARRARRGAPVLALLAVAGLLRPEAWALAGLYVVFLWRGAAPRDRVRWVALAALAPLVWALTDLVVTGDALHSLHGTAALAEENERRRTLGEAPRWTAQYLAFTLREPLVVGVPIGLLLAWRHRRRREVLLPVVVAAVMLAVFAAGPVLGLPLIGRYVRTPAVLLALFYGLAVAGWTLLPPGRARRGWLAAGVLALLLSVAFLPRHVTLLGGLHERVERDGRFYGDLRAAVQAPRVRAAFAACAPLTAADHRPIPYVRDWLDGAPGSVGTVEDGASPLGRVLLVPRRTPLPRRAYGVDFPRVTPPAAYRTVHLNRSWRVLAAPGCPGA